MPQQLPIDSLSRLPDNHLAALAGVLDAPIDPDEPSDRDPFIDEIVAPVREEILRRAVGRASSAATVTIFTAAEIDWRLLEVRARMYDALARFFGPHPRLADYPRAIAALLRQEKASRRANAEGYAALQ
jgi:hypothetical protein